jgi:hypothetical protein
MSISAGDLLQGDYRRWFGCGVSPQTLRQSRTSAPEKRLVDRWRTRAQQGRDQNLENYKIYAAIDAAWDAGFRQTSQTLIGLIRDLAESSGDDPMTPIETARKWGLTHLIVDQKDPKTGKPTGRKMLSLPVMYG